MRENCTSGTVPGAPGNRRPYGGGFSMSDEPSIASNLELTAKVLALGASFSLVASLIYDWGFYSALSLSFLEVPTAMSDHVRSALIWFPKVFACLITLFVFEMLTRSIEKGMTEEELIQSSPNPSRTRRFREGPWRLIAYTSIFPVAGYILVGAVFLHALPLALCILWFAFSVWAQSHPRIIARRPRAYRMAAHFVPPIIIWLYFAGYTEAVRLYDTATPIARLTNSSSTIDSVVLLRLLDKGALVKEPSSAVAFRPWSEIKKLETPGKYTPAQGIICVWFHIGCIAQSKSAL